MNCTNPICMKHRLTLETIAAGEEPGYSGSLASASMLSQIATDALKPTPEELGAVALFPDVHHV
jgi:hypothetical protein